MQIIPQTIADEQLMSMNRKPTRIDGVRVMGDMYDMSSLRCKDKNPKPVPTSKLNEGPAKQPKSLMILDENIKSIDALKQGKKRTLYSPVVAMSGMPFFAMAIFADKSPIELPLQKDTTNRERVSNEHGEDMIQGMINSYPC